MHRQPMSCRAQAEVGVVILLAALRGDPAVVAVVVAHAGPEELAGPVVSLMPPASRELPVDVVGRRVVATMEQHLPMLVTAELGLIHNRSQGESDGLVVPSEQVDQLVDHLGPAANQEQPLLTTPGVERTASTRVTEQVAPVPGASTWR